MESSEKREQKEALENIKQQSAKMKKRILKILVSMLIVLVLLFSVIFVLEWIVKRNDGKIPDFGYEFYPKYEGSIFTDEEYLGLDRQVYYCAEPSGYGITHSITQDNLMEFDRNVLFLYDYIQTIIQGDAQGYNACFNATYFKKQDEKAAFSQQMVYNIKITFLSNEPQSDGSRLYEYRLEYMIHRNDGTFRTDIASDALGRQTVTLRMDTDGNISIEKLVTHYNKQ